MAVSEQINLVLVYKPNAVDVEDFNKIGRRVQTLADNINVHIQIDQAPEKALLDELAQHRTLVFSPMQMRAFYVQRGRIYAGRPMQKSEQLLRLELAGVPVPPWTSLNRGKRFDPEWWGEYVVVKPEIGSAGRGVTVQKTSWLNEQSYKLDPFTRDGSNFIVQKMIHSKLFSKIRIHMLFDKVLCAFQFRFPETIKFDSEDDLKNFQKHFIPKNNKPEFCNMEELFVLAKRCYQAFDGVALLGLDAVLDETGNPFFIEANPGGNTWHYSSAYMGQRLTSQGIFLEQQFGAFDRAGDVLANRALEEAI